LPQFKSPEIKSADIKSADIKSADIKVTKTSSPKAKPEARDLGFGKYFTDHLFMSKYTKSKGWHNSEIIPYQDFHLNPAASVFHYGQALFEGMKAFKYPEGEAILFRPEYNCDRLTSGAQRLCMQAPPKELMLAGIKQLVQLDQSWIPSEDGCALYIRPTLIGTEGFLGVRPSEEYLFYVILSPVGSYYGSQLTPIPIWIETTDLRAAPGGLGATKAGANYAASLRAAVQARQKGFSQVLWLDAEHQAIEEVGTMNVFFVIKDRLITPALNGSILAGNTRDCVLSLAKEWGWAIEERRITLNELIQASAAGDLQECFGTGTAATISPVSRLESEHHKLIIGKPQDYAIGHQPEKHGEGQIGPRAKRLYDEISGLQRGRIKDSRGWVTTL
jgi:branched-chain amino acid aminotransferase